MSAAIDSLRHRLSVLYISGIGGEGVALDLRLALDELDEIEQSVRSADSEPRA